MVKREYLQALARAKKEMIDLLKQRQRIDARISRLKTLIYDLAALQQDLHDSGKSPAHSGTLDPKLGLTKSIRQILQDAAPVGLSANEIKQAMETRGFNFSKYSSPLSSLLTILNRLVSQGSVGEERARGKEKKFRWYSELEIALGLLEDADEPDNKKRSK